MPELLNALPRLLARLHPDNPKYKELEEQLYRIQAGYAGEIKVDKYLESIDFLEPVHIFTDLQLPINPGYAIQIDTLILTPSCAFILEIKNIAGTLVYNSNPPHFECNYVDKQPIIIDCPIMQLNNNRTGLDMWLKSNGFPLRTSGMIVMANNKTAVKNVPDDIPIMYAKHLPYYFRTKVIEKEILSHVQFRELIGKLKLSQTPYNPYPLSERYRIDPYYIRKGVICENCNNEIIRTNHMIWICPSCKTECRQPYIHGMRDWFMLIKRTISNEECRNYFKLKDKYAANYILKLLPLTRTGNSTATVYSWDYKTSPHKIQKRRDHTSKN